MEGNFKVTAQAEDGQVALDLLNAGLVVDVVVTDVNMPKMDGIVLTAAYIGILVLYK